MAVTRLPVHFRPDGGGELVSKAQSRECKHCLEVITRPDRRIQNEMSIAQVSVRSHGSVMKVALLIAVGVLVIQIAGTRAASNTGSKIRVEVKVPREVEVGSSAELKCEWWLQDGNSLYSVKWYKDDHEFFRFVPDDNPSIRTFKQNGVSLDESRNSERSVKLKDLNLTSSGQYKCEVSIEAPSFAATYQTANLTVIVPPVRGPEITGLTRHYTVGDNVTANCTAWPSVPKANLRWTINGKPVPKENIIEHPAISSIISLGIPNTQGLRFEAESRHIEEDGGLVKIKCIAQVGSRIFEDEKKTFMSYVNNQRLSAGDFLRGHGKRHRGDLLTSLALLLLIVFFTT